MPYVAPVIVVPGITATQLRDEYVLPPETVWSAVLNKDYVRIALHPDNIRYEERRLTGDGTVPFEGALPKFLPLGNIVCVTPEDFGYWEVQDRLVSSMAGFHGILPNMDMLHRLIVRHLTGRPDPRGNTWGRPAPGVTTNWQPPLQLNRK